VPSVGNQLVYQEKMRPVSDSPWLGTVVPNHGESYFRFGTLPLLVGQEKGP